ncbi:MAG: xanthine dehydrogenase family protein subunit M [Pseudomonadota bacterium]|nr:xanthine dehydrogenase family protein subunit M [Pseudomonadota bacterium]MEE3288528.1 xanthine dehydrogenase family protein subunit M [Pseudomonadota bacterium]
MRYEVPETVDAAVALLAAANGSASILAGGTDLLVQLRAGLVEPDVVVDIKKISQTRQITAQDGGFRVGAAVTGAELDEHAELKKVWPGVVEATELIGSTQIQGRATMGGNLCNASPAADSVPALIAAAATCQIAGPSGERTVPVESICTGPGKTILDPGEFVVSLILPARPSHSGDAYLRFIPRTEMDIAVVGVGVSLTLDDAGQCTAARIGLGAVAATALLVTEAADALLGTAVDEGAVEKMQQAVRAACRPIDDKRGTIAYRTQVSGVLAGRACRIALERAGEH